MTITLTLSPEVEAKLLKEAARQGKDVSVVAAELLVKILEWQTQDIDLNSYSIDQVQAEILRTNLTIFADDWNSPEMSIYDNYDANKTEG